MLDFKLIFAVIVFEKEASLLIADAILFSVFKIEGGEPDKLVISLWTYSVVAICVVFVPRTAVGANGTPVNSGEAIFAFRLIAVIATVDNGLSKSLVLSTCPRPIIADVIPLTFPVNVGELIVAYLFIKDIPFS